MQPDGEAWKCFTIKNKKGKKKTSSDSTSAEFFEPINSEQNPSFESHLGCAPDCTADRDGITDKMHG